MKKGLSLHSPGSGGGAGGGLDVIGGLGHNNNFAPQHSTETHLGGGSMGHLTTHAPPHPPSHLANPNMQGKVFITLVKNQSQKRCTNYRLSRKSDKHFDELPHQRRQEREAKAASNPFYAGSAERIREELLEDSLPGHLHA